MLEGNPFVLELVYQKKNVYTHLEWEKLMRESKRFITTETVNQHLNYINSQLKKYKKNFSKEDIKKSNQSEATQNTENKRFIGKRAYHMVRLLFTVSRLVRGLEPIVYLSSEFEESNENNIRDETEAEIDINKISLEVSIEKQRKLLIHIRKNLVPPIDLINFVENGFKTIESQKPWKVNEEPPTKFLDKWLIDSRLSIYQNEIKING